MSTELQFVDQIARAGRACWRSAGLATALPWLGALLSQLAEDGLTAALADWLPTSPWLGMGQVFAWLGAGLLVAGLSCAVLVWYLDTTDHGHHRGSPSPGTVAGVIIGGLVGLYVLALVWFKVRPWLLSRSADAEAAVDFVNEFSPALLLLLFLPGGIVFTVIVVTMSVVYLPPGLRSRPRWA